jgi:hypothetical protein
MEGVFMCKDAVKKIVQNQNLLDSEINLPKDIHGSYSPEVWLYNLINGCNITIDCITYEHSTNNYNIILGKNFGLFHKNAGLRGWKD